MCAPFGRASHRPDNDYVTIGHVTISPSLREGFGVGSESVNAARGREDLAVGREKTGKDPFKPWLLQDFIKTRLLGGHGDSAVGRGKTVKYPYEP